MNILKNIRLKDISSNRLRLLLDPTYRKDIKQMVGKYNIVEIKLAPFRLERSESSWNQLERSLAKGYNPKRYGYITICRFFGINYPIDGNHRLAMLKKLYSEDYTIDVKTVSPIRIICCMVLFIPLILLSITLAIVNNLLTNVNNFITRIFRIKIK
jgi:hypothetical protein